MSRNIAAAGLSLALLAALAWTRPAPANNEHPNWVLPSCDAALDEIASAFREKEYRFWKSNAQIVDFAQVQETAFRPWAADVMSRRFCRADAEVTDGAWHPVYFSIEAGMGEIGATWGVQWCVVGFDRNWAYNPDCRMAKP